MASWEEHLSAQTGINLLLAKLTGNPLIFLFTGVVQHWILDDLIIQRPPNMFAKNLTKEVLSLAVSGIAVASIALLTGFNWLFLLGLVGAILPDILEGIRLLFSGNMKKLWYAGDVSAFHLSFIPAPLINTVGSYWKDMLRRVIIFIIVIGVMICGFC